MPISNDLNGRVALVTGAAGNIGSAIRDALSAAGAAIFATDLRGDADRDTHPHDVTSEQGWADIIAHVEARHGRLDILINNAGTAPMGYIEATTLDDWRRCQAINVEGPLLGMKAALALLARSGDRPGGSSIINIASAAATRASPMAAAYCSSKAALVMLSKVAAVEFGTLGHPVRVNTVNPGAVESDMINDIVDRYSVILDGMPIEDLKKAMRSDVPMGRLARPDDVADAVLFLASSASRFVSGTELRVDGGFTAR